MTLVPSMVEVCTHLTGSPNVLTPFCGALTMIPYLAGKRFFISTLPTSPLFWLVVESGQLIMTPAGVLLA